VGCGEGWLISEAATEFKFHFYPVFLVTKYVLTAGCARDSFKDTLFNQTIEVPNMDKLVGEADGSHTNPLTGRSSLSICHGKQKSGEGDV
jgi:hypothetical protein